MERPLPAKRGKLQIPEVRPDISGRIDGDAVVIEMQASALSISQIIKRTTAYANWDISMLWVVPLKEASWRGWFQATAVRAVFPHHVLRAHVVLVARQGHAVAAGALWPRDAPHPYSESYEQGGELVTVGGYDKAYKAIKRPEHGPPVCISADCAAMARDPFVPENKKKTVPSCLPWFDGKQPWWPLGQQGEAAAPPQGRRSELHRAIGR